MSKKDQWKKAISEQVVKHYGEYTAEEAKKLDEALELHWKLNQQHAAYFLSRIAGTFIGIPVGTFVNLSSFLPMTPLAGILGRATFMAFSYMAASYLSASVLEKVLPALDRLEQSQLASLFKKADTRQDFLKLMQSINNYLALTVTQDKEERKNAALCVGIGSLVNGGLFAAKGVSSGMVVRGAAGLPVLGSHAPKFHKILTRSQLPVWTSQFGVKRSATESKEHSENEGLRQRRPGGTSTAS